MKYSKINTLWKREDNKKGNIIEGEYSMLEFHNIKLWYVEEKIDSTNVRVIYTPDTLEFRGRTDNAKIHEQGKLLEWLKENITISDLKKEFGDTEVILYGEGFDPKINTMWTDTGFVLFDIKIGKFWLTRDSVKDIAERLFLDTPPFLGVMNEEEITQYVKTEPYSKYIGDRYDMFYLSEGIVARPVNELFARNGDRVIFKLKLSDYRKLNISKPKTL